MRLYTFFAKDCLLTLVKSRLALGSPRCSFGCSSPCRKWPNTQGNGCWLPLSDHIQSETLFQTRQDQEKGMNGPASLLHSWRWVLFRKDLGQTFLVEMKRLHQVSLLPTQWSLANWLRLTPSLVALCISHTMNATIDFGIKCRHVLRSSLDLLLKLSPDATVVPFSIFRLFL